MQAEQLFSNVTKAICEHRHSSVSFRIKTYLTPREPRTSGSVRVPNSCPPTFCRTGQGLKCHHLLASNVHRDKVPSLRRSNGAAGEKEKKGLRFPLAKREYLSE